MQQKNNPQKLAHHIGFVISDIITILGAMITLVAIIEIKRTDAAIDSYLDSYQYDMLTMKTYGIALMLGGFLAHLAEYIMVMISDKNINIMNLLGDNNSSKKEKPSCCELCGTKNTALYETEIGNETLYVCSQCRSEEKT